jgi:DNA-directed RNA polymerase I, II, and III subunit RPABC4
MDVEVPAVASGEAVNVDGAAYAQTGTAEREGSKYICGDCGHKNKLKHGDTIRCRSCGYRILYKARTKHIVQYEAR